MNPIARFESACWWRPARLVALLWMTCLALAGLGNAQTTTTGNVQGRVYNPAAKEFVRNAEVRVEGTNRVVFTESDGWFLFADLPAGPVTVTVAFVGYHTARDAFSVQAGTTTVREINLVSAETTLAPSKEEIVHMEALVVSTAREGNAKAVMNQRRNMNITTSVSSDIFGTVTDGNVGEFLKYLPGVDLDYQESEVRGPRLGGMDGQYVGVAFDGMRMASADGQRATGTTTRATSFEGFSITSIESIEINRTASPENDADTPAGLINMKTKRAFDRKEQRAAYNVSANFNAEEFTLKRTAGPGDIQSYKWKPNYQFDYSRSLFNNRLGILLSVSHADSYTKQYQTTVTYNDMATATDPRPLVVRQINTKDSPKLIGKDAILLTADWKASPFLVFSFNGIYSKYRGDIWNRVFSFVGSADTNSATNGRSALGGDGITTIIANRTTANTNPRIDNTGTTSVKQTWTRTLSPTFEFRRGAWVVDGGIARSWAWNDYNSVAFSYLAGEGGSAAASWVATRPTARSSDWTLTQTSGADWKQYSNYSNTNSRNGGTWIGNDNRELLTEIWTGTLNAKWIVPFMKRFPTSIKIGGKWTEETRKNDNYSSVDSWAYVGQGGNTLRVNATTGAYESATFGNWANLGPRYLSAEPFNLGSVLSFRFVNIDGKDGAPQRVNRNAVGELFTSHPEFFASTATPSDYYSAFYANKRDLKQIVSAGYSQVDIRLASNVQLRFGMRYEETANQFREFNPLKGSEVLAAGYAVSGGRAVTIPGLVYQYTSRPRVTRKTNYHNFFPSVVVKYQILPNLEYQAGFNKAISRAPIDNLTGLWSIDEVNLRITASNPNLKPEYHSVFQTRLAYYFGNRSPGQFSAAFSQDQGKNFRQTLDMTADEYGVTDPQYTAYVFRTISNSLKEQRYRNMDLNYTQTLGMLPSPYLRGISVGATYSRTYVNVRRPDVAPERFTGRLGYSYGRFNGQLGMVWRDAAPDNSGRLGRIKGALTQFDIGLNFRVNRWAVLYLNARNITNVPVRWYQTETTLPERSQTNLQQVEAYGANWVFGLRGVF